MDTKTEQFNIRLPTSLMYDLELISNYTTLNKSDWVRMNIAKSVRAAKEEILDDLERSFVRQTISKEDFKRLIGVPPRAEIVAKRKEYQQHFEKMAKSKENIDSARKALLGMVPSKRPSVKKRA